MRRGDSGPGYGALLIQTFRVLRRPIDYMLASPGLGGRMKAAAAE
jgi:hypothetical protein